MATKSVALSALFLLCTISCISESHAWPFPWLHPIPHPHPIPLPWQNPKFKTCITALHQRAQNCLHEITSSYTRQRVSIGSKCCEAIQEVDKDCGSTIFAHFKAPFFHLLLKEHCANKDCQPKVGSPAPKIGGGEPVSPAPEPSDDEPALPPMPRDDGDYDPLAPSPAPGSESPAADQY